MAIELKIVTPILITCGVVFVIAVVLVSFLWCRSRRAKKKQKESLYRGFTRRHCFEVSCTPSPGSYCSPTRVHLTSTFAESSNILVDVSFAPLPNDRQDTPVRLLGTDEHYAGQFLLYKDPFEFVNPGRYTIYAHTVYPTMRLVGAVHLFVFDILADDAPGRTACPADSFAAAPFVNSSATAPFVDSLAAAPFVDSSAAAPFVNSSSSSPPPPPRRALPLPPRIIPAKGEVTIFTPITIAPHEESRTADQIRFSADGTYPSLLYTGPFTLSVPPNGELKGAQHVPIIIRALAVSGHDDAMTSSVAEANLVVYTAGHTFFDPQIPTPVARIVAKEADLYFDVSGSPPNSKILYQLVYINEARQKAKFSRKRSIEYNGQPVRLKEDLAYVYAWTFLESDIDFSNRNNNRGEKRHIRSSAAVYDCAGASTWNRGPNKDIDMDGGNATLPPPVICVSCKEMELFFEDPPAGGIICYTLDNTDPSRPDISTTAKHMAAIGFGGATRMPQEFRKDERHMNTHVYRENQPIHVTLLRTEKVFVTARTFIPVADPSAGGAITGYRFGGRFCRSFIT